MKISIVSKSLQQLNGFKLSPILQRDSTESENQDELCHVATNVKILEEQGTIMTMYIIFPRN